ncbi:hypothetical protein ES705_48979 [subsurface metagenome]
MPTLKITPHSIADWDWQHGASYRSLSATHFISAPTSLRFMAPTPPSIYTTALCRIASTLCLPQGEVRTWWRMAAAEMNVLTFRNQAPLDSADRENCYLLYSLPTRFRLFRVLAGHMTIVGDALFDYTSDTWHHVRCRFWNGENPEGVPCLCVNIYVEEEGDWVQCSITLYDEVNLFKDSDINRCGILPASVFNIPNYYDDTEIWGPV